MKEGDDGMMNGDGDEVSVPVFGEKLLHMIMPKDIRDDAIRTARERFKENVRRFGVRFARVMYWRDVIESTWPFVTRAAYWAAGFIPKIDGD